RKAVEKFAGILKEYNCFSVSGDNYAAQTFPADFGGHGISFRPTQLQASKLYAAMEPRLNSGEIVLLDDQTMENQFLGLVWRGGKITHLLNEHDDHANAVAGALHLAAVSASDVQFYSGGEDRVEWDW